MAVRRPSPRRARSRRRHRRRRLFLAAGLLAASVAAWVAWRAAGPPGYALEPDDDRNVLLVTIDTLRADALGCYGGGAATPNLDRLAAHGARFTRAHAHAVVTLASHATILTGRYPYEHGIRDNTGYHLEPSQTTAAALLAARGFATAAFVSGFPLDRRFGLDAGFDAYDDRLDPASATDAGERERRADATVAAAVDWIGRQHGKWFAWVHVYDPHAPYAPPQPFASQYAASPYLGEVAWTDSALGTLFDRLGEMPRDTLVVVTGDHGEGLGDHGERTHSIFAYEATLHVPLIVAEAGQDVRPAAGVIISGSVRHVDILPTLLDAVSAPVDATLAGASLRPLIADAGGDDRLSYFEAMTAAVTRGWAPLRGVIAGREKYIDLPIPELYDLSADPRERQNLAERRPDRIRALRALLESFDVAPPVRAGAETTETLDRLRSLGYIGGGAVAIRERYTEADDPKRLIALEQMLQDAAEAQRQGRVQNAIALYARVIATRPDTEDAYRKLALVYWRQGRSNDAIATLERALANGVTQSEVRIKLAQYLAESGRPQRAIALLEGTAGADPDALLGLGNAYAAAGRDRDAVATYKRLLALDPRSALAYQNLGSVRLRKRDFAEAERLLRRALELDDRLSGAHTALGVVLARTARRDEAIDAWKRAIAIDPGELDALFDLTVNLVQAGRREEAHQYGEQFLTIAPATRREDRDAINSLLGK